MLGRWFKARGNDATPAKPATPAEAPGWLPDAHFGGVSEVPEPPAEPDGEDTLDDEDPTETPPEIVMMLGFDPMIEFEGEGAGDEQDA